MVLLAFSGKKRKKRKKKNIKKLNSMLRELSREYSWNSQDLNNILEGWFGFTSSDIIVPLEIFSSEELGPLEAVVKYMGENLKMKYNEIAIELNRNENTIRSSYKRAVEKQKKKFTIKKSGRKISLEEFNIKGLTILESLVNYFKEKGMKYVEIGELLGKDQRNIWTIYDRVKKKNIKAKTFVNKRELSKLILEKLKNTL